MDRRSGSSSVRGQFKCSCQDDHFGCTLHAALIRRYSWSVWSNTDGQRGLRGMLVRCGVRMEAFGAAGRTAATN
eukprot:6210642-Pleurochrysis_carterae.AAC.1